MTAASLYQAQTTSTKLHQADAIPAFTYKYQVQQVDRKRDWRSAEIQTLLYAGKV